jgi:hypothetical protein
VDDETVRGEIALSPGAQISLGEVTLLFEPRDRGVTRVRGTTEIPESLRAASGREAISPRLRMLLLFAGLGVLLLAGYLLLR